MSKYSLKYLSQKLNVSVSTVSKALNGYSDINSKTKERIIKLAKDLNFIPNSQASFLRTRKTKLIGIIVPFISHPFFSNIINGIVTSAEKKGYLTIVLKSKDSCDREKILVEKLLSQNVDGIFISLTQETNRLDYLENIKNEGVVLVQIDKISKIVKSSKVVINDQESAYIATKHLIKNGCKKILHYRGSLISQVSIDRFLGYKKALEDHDINYDPKLVVVLDKMTDKEGFEATSNFISKKIEFDGIFAISDYTAVGAIECLKKNNFNVPNDVKVVGFNNWPFSDKLSPSLSTLDQPGELMGNMSFKLFLKEIRSRKNKTNFSFEKKIFKTKLVIRESSL